MSKFRDGDPVLVHVAAGRAKKPAPRKATFRGQGQDSGGAWVLVEFPSGVTELVHPNRVTTDKEET